MVDGQCGCPDNFISLLRALSLIFYSVHFYLVINRDFFSMVQVKDLETRLAEMSSSKAALEENMKTSEHFARSLEAELQTTKTSLEGKQKELKEVQDRVSSSYISGF